MRQLGNALEAFQYQVLYHNDFFCRASTMESTGLVNAVSEKKEGGLQKLVR